MSNIKQIVLKDNDRKSIILIIRDLIKMRMKYKDFNDVKSTYIGCLMFKKNSGKIEDYLPTSKWGKLKKYHFFQNGPALVLNDKPRFSQFMTSQGFPVAGFLGKIENGYLLDGANQKHELINQADLTEKIKDLFKIAPDCFIKKSDSNQGKDVFKVNIDNLNEVVKKIDIKEQYIIEKTIVQHHAVSEINPDCLNTLRVMTYRSGDRVEVADCIFKMGVKGIHADNGVVGGMFIPYDIKNNKLACTAYQNITHGAKSFEKHPDTGFIFKDKPLPFPKEILKMAKEAALLFDREWIGWDIGYSPDGPIFVEGNGGPSIVFMQIASKGLFADPLYKEVFGYLK